MNDLEQALGIFERKFGTIGNLKFLLANGMEIDSVASDFLAIAESARDSDFAMYASYPEPGIE